MEEDKIKILSLIKREAKRGKIMLPKPNISFIDETEFYFLNEEKTKVSVLLSLGRTCVWWELEKRSGVWLKVPASTRWNKTGLGVYFIIKGADYQKFYES